MVSLADCVDDLQFVKFGITCWALWEDRNKIHFGEALTTVEYKSEWILHYADDLSNMAEPGRISDGSMLDNLRSCRGLLSSWCPPYLGVFILK